MQVADVMTRDVRVSNPNQSIFEAAKLMEEYDCGSIPVAENDKLVGMATDRDIVIRGLAHGKTGDTKISEIMTQDIKYCFEDEDVEAVAQNMGELQVRRLPVVNRDKRLVGIVTLGDLSQSGESQCVGDALSDISQPSAQSSESAQRPH
ncbi:MAG: CBS domain-containing protein [Burkholderiaceae bacterium]